MAPLALILGVKALGLSRPGWERHQFILALTPEGDLAFREARVREQGRPYRISVFDRGDGIGLRGD